MKVKKTILKNNVTLLEKEVVNSKVTTIGFYFAAGSRFENSGEYGISHFTEHLLFKGTAAKSCRDISCIFDRMGATFNAFTERENVGVYCTVPSERAENFSLALDVLCDLSANCIFPPEEVEKERSVVQSEILSAEDDPDDSAMDEVASQIWRGTNLARTISGSVSDVQKISREQIIGWYEKFFKGGELVVIAVGKIYKSELISALEKLPLHKPSVEFFRGEHFAEEPEFFSGTKISRAKFKQAQIFSVFPVKANLSADEYFALQIFNSAAGDSMSGRLFSVLREQEGLCYSVGSFFVLYEKCGVWISYAVCEKFAAAKLLEKMENEILNFLQDEISDDEIEIAKERLCGQEILGETHTSFLLQRIWNFYSMGFPVMETDEILFAVRSVKKSDIIALIKNLLTEKRASIVFAPNLPHKIKRKILCKTKSK